MTIVTKNNHAKKIKNTYKTTEIHTHDCNIKYYDIFSMKMRKADEKCDKKQTCKKCKNTYKTTEIHNHDCNIKYYDIFNMKKKTNESKSFTNRKCIKCKLLMDTASYRKHICNNKKDNEVQLIDLTSSSCSDNDSNSYKRKHTTKYIYTSKDNGCTSKKANLKNIYEATTSKIHDFNSEYQASPDEEKGNQYGQKTFNAHQKDDRKHYHGYRDKDEHETSRQIYRQHGTEVIASELVEALAKCPNWKETLLNLFEKEGMEPSRVRNIVSKTPFIFHLDGEFLALKPQISLCEEHMQDGCRSRNTCRRLHICDKYITGDCQSESCLMGHKWDTNHNSSVLKEYSLNSLPSSTLDKLIYDMTLPSKPDWPLEICMDYNMIGCGDISCNQLHLCLNLVKYKSSCKKDNCKLNHNVLDHSCLKILTSYGISVNDSPLDILNSILQINTSLLNIMEIDDDSKNRKQKSKKKSRETKATESDSDETSDSPDNLNDSHTTRSNKSEQKTRLQNNFGTVWFDYPLGDVNIPEICYYSVESICKDESSGCDRLHSTQHFHWQISDLGDSWYNLTLPHSKCLEFSYCNPEKEDVTLKRLNPLNLDRSLPSSRDLLMLMGRDKWKADFNKMIISSSSQSKVLKLRRLCTQNISGKDIDGNQFSWYFKDKNNKWIEYGNVDSTDDKLKSSISSKDIEKEFKQNQEKPFSFNNSKFNYSLDFINMKQTNTQTNVAREVKRRPKLHYLKTMKTKNVLQKTNKINLPSTWEPMQPRERVRMINLQPSSSEYQTVVNMFMGNYTITQIERIQNPFHYRAFENKRQDMIAIYNNDSSKVDVRQLFHGTKSSVIKSICSENFDWRLHGTSTGNVYGKGTYFSPDITVSYNYCPADSSSGFKYMFIARVALGTMIVGDSSMSRPPNNPATNMPYDTTVNTMSNPTIIVKYDKQEYYPEYIVTFK